LRAATQSRRRGSPASDRRRAHWHRLGGQGGEGHQRDARRREGGTGGRPERLDDVRTSAAGGRCRSTTSGILRLPARTRGSGEKCRGPQRASPGEESTAWEREKKGGTAVTFYRVAQQIRRWGAPAGSGVWRGGGERRSRQWHASGEIGSRSGNAVA
jgi:hypothetical protein